MRYGLGPDKMPDNTKERFDKSKSVGDKAKELCSHIVDEVKDVCSYVSEHTCGDCCLAFQGNGR